MTPSFILILNLFLSSSLGSPVPTTAVNYAQVLALEGNAWKTEASATEKVPLKLGDHLGSGTRIQTSTASLLTLKLGRDVTNLVKASTVATLELKNDIDWSVNLEKGAVLSAVKNPAQRPNHFSVRTKMASMGVRGTAFFVKQELGKAPYFCTCHGSVEIRDEDNQLIEEIKTTHHDRPVKVGKPLKKVPMDTEHSDAEIQVLENWLDSATP